MLAIIFFSSQEYKNTSGFLPSHKLTTFAPGLELFMIQLPALTWHQTQQRQQDSWWVETWVRTAKVGKEWLVSTNFGGRGGIECRLGVGKWSLYHLSGFCAGANTAIKLTASNTAAIWQQHMSIPTRQCLGARRWCSARTLGPCLDQEVCRSRNPDLAKEIGNTGRRLGRA